MNKIWNFGQCRTQKKENEYKLQAMCNPEINTNQFQIINHITNIKHIIIKGSKSFF